MNTAARTKASAVFPFARAMCRQTKRIVYRMPRVRRPFRTVGLRRSAAPVQVTMAGLD